MAAKILVVLVLGISVSVIVGCPIQYGCYCHTTENYVICHPNLSETTLPLVIQQIPASSTKLTLKSYSGKALQPNAFRTLNNLKSLTIYSDSSGSLREIDKDAFTGLNILTSLEILNSNITTFPNDIFSALTSLTNLSLAHNRLVNVPDSLTSTSIQHLDLSWNQLTSLKDNTLEGLANLQTLFLDNNTKLMTLTTNTFARLINLEKLSTRNCQLQMTAGHFKSLSKLKHLDLYSGMKMHRFPPKFFEGLTSLEILNLGSCGLQEIEQFDFTPFVSSALKHLDLSYNELPVIKNNTFFDCKNMEVLNLSNKKGSDEPRVYEHCAFRGLQSLKTLDISGNNLKTVPKTFDLVLGFIKQANITATRNDVNCNCATLPLSNWIRDQNVTLDMPCLHVYASNISGIQVQALNATVLKCTSKPVFDFKVNVTTKPINISKNMSYECSAYAYDAHPKLTYMVTKGNPFPKNDTNITETEENEMEGKFRVSLMFEFENYTKEHVGIINCTATNDYGGASMIIEVVYDGAGLPIWAIVLIVIIVLAVVVGAAILGWWLYQKRWSTPELFGGNVYVDSSLTKTYL